MGIILCEILASPRTQLQGVVYGIRAELRKLDTEKGRPGRRQNG